MMTGLLTHHGFFNVVAELDGRVVGSNFLDQRGPICGIGPITIDPAMEHAQQRNVAGLRLVQAGYHNRSLALYLKLGFNAREQLACVKGPATACVVERLGCLTGDATVMGFSGQAVRETSDDLKALLGAAEAFQGAGVLVPTRNNDLLRWCLEQNLKITQTMTLMTMGLYNQPNGAWLPSILY